VLLGSGLNFTNTFTLSYYARRSRKSKKTDDLTVFFTLLGSVRIKAVRRTLMKLSPGRIKAGRKHVDEIDNNSLSLALPPSLSLSLSLSLSHYIEFICFSLLWFSLECECRSSVIMIYIGKTRKTSFFLQRKFVPMLLGTLTLSTIFTLMHFYDWKKYLESKGVCLQLI